MHTKFLSSYQKKKKKKEPPRFVFLDCSIASSLWVIYFIMYYRLEVDAFVNQTPLLFLTSIQS